MTIRQTILRLINKIPFLNSFVYFRLYVWRISFAQFFVLWLVSSLPVLAQFLFKDHPELKTLFSTNVILVYTSAFIAPIIWRSVQLVREAANTASSEDSGHIESIKNIRTFPSAHLWLIGGILVLCMSIMTYGEDPNSLVFKKNSPIGYILYIFSILIWLLTLADSNNSSNYSKTVVNEEDNFHVLTQGGR